MESAYINSVIAVMAIATIVPRALPFVVLYRFESNRALLFVGKTLPLLVMPLLVIYSLKPQILDPNFLMARELAASSIVILAHYWKRNALLSIFLGTAAYIKLITIS